MLNKYDKLTKEEHYNKRLDLSEKYSDIVKIQHFWLSKARKIIENMTFSKFITQSDQMQLIREASMFCLSRVLDVAILDKEFINIRTGIKQTLDIYNKFKEDLNNIRNEISHANSLNEDSFNTKSKLLLYNFNINESDKTYILYKKIYETINDKDLLSKLNDISIKYQQESSFGKSEDYCDKFNKRKNTITTQLFYNIKMMQICITRALYIFKHEKSKLKHCSTVESMALAFIVSWIGDCASTLLNLLYLNNLTKNTKKFKEKKEKIKEPLKESLKEYYIKPRPKNMKDNDYELFKIHEIEKQKECEINNNKLEYGIIDPKSFFEQYFNINQEVWFGLTILRNDIIHFKRINTKPQSHKFNPLQNPYHFLETSTYEHIPSEDCYDINKIINEYIKENFPKILFGLNIWIDKFDTFNIMKYVSFHKKLMP